MSDLIRPPCPDRCGDACHAPDDCVCACHARLRGRDSDHAPIDWERIVNAPFCRECWIGQLCGVHSRG